MRESIRASDHERRTTTELLGQAAAEGRLTLEEHAERVSTALVATHRAQLDELTEDLSASTASVAPAGAGLEESRAHTIFGDLERAGAWSVPASGVWRTVFGDIELDLRRARLTAAVTTLDLSTVFGDVEVLVPSGVVVEVRSRTAFGDVRQSSEEPVAPGAPRLVLTGTCLFGDVRVLDAPRSSRWKRWLGRSEDGDRDPNAGGTAR